MGKLVYKKMPGAAEHQMKNIPPAKNARMVAAEDDRKKKDKMAKAEEKRKRDEAEKAAKKAADAAHKKAAKAKAQVQVRARYGGMATRSPTSCAVHHRARAALAGLRAPGRGDHPSPSPSASLPPPQQETIDVAGLDGASSMGDGARLRLHNNNNNGGWDEELERQEEERRVRAEMEARREEEARRQGVEEEGRRRVEENNRRKQADRHAEEMEDQRRKQAMEDALRHLRGEAQAQGWPPQQPLWQQLWLGQVQQLPPPLPERGGGGGGRAAGGYVTGGGDHPLAAMLPYGAAAGGGAAGMQAPPYAPPLRLQPRPPDTPQDEVEIERKLHGLRSARNMPPGEATQLAMEEGMLRFDLERAKRKRKAQQLDGGRY